MIILRQLVGVLTFAMLGLVFAVGDILTRVLVQPTLWLRPSSRRSVLTAWAHGVAGAIVALLRWPGRARVDIRAEIPGRGGVLMVANHQSTVDIPVVFGAVRGGYPRYVVHYRYGKDSAPCLTALGCTGFDRCCKSRR